MSKRGNDGLLAKAATFIYEWTRSEATHSVGGYWTERYIYILEDLTKVKGIKCVNEAYG